MAENKQVTEIKAEVSFWPLFTLQCHRVAKTVLGSLKNKNILQM